MKKQLTGSILALTLCTSLSVPAFAAATDNLPATAHAEYVMLNQAQVRFVDTDGNVICETGLSGYRGISVPAVSGQNITWYALSDGNRMELRSGDYLSAQTLDLDYLWTRDNPSITFTMTPPAAVNGGLTAKAPVVPEYVILDHAQVKFVDDKGDVILETGLSGYRGINAPAVNGQNVTWTASADGNELELKSGDYLSAQTLDLDYLWTRDNPSITFTMLPGNDFIPEQEAPEEVVRSFHVQFIDPSRSADRAILKDVVLDEDNSSVNALRLIVNGDLADWQTKCGALVVSSGEAVTLDMLTEAYPDAETAPDTIIFTPVGLSLSAAPDAVLPQAVTPESFTLNFMLDGEVYDSFELYPGEYEEAFQIIRGEADGATWSADCIAYTMSGTDAIYYSSLADNFTWTELNPVVTFTVVETN